jgi:hypothetical protein
VIFNFQPSAFAGLFPNPAITIASVDCIRHCEVASTVTIS